MEKQFSPPNGEQAPHPLVPRISLPPRRAPVQCNPLGSESSRLFEDRACDTCRWDGNPSSILHWTRRVVLDAARGDPSEFGEDSCARCKILVLILEHFHLRGTETHRYQDCDFTSCIWNEIIGSRYEKLSLFTSTEFCEVEALCGIRKQPIAHSKPTMEASIFWAREQIESHQDCWRSQTIGGSFVPTRLIDIDPSGLDGDVLLADNVLSDSRYVALSYCWGRCVPSCQTTRSTYLDRKKRIPWSTLPKTFRDAVVFTRKLGIKYLWIDCICIMQGDADDWARESGRMFHVYKYAYATLAAVWGSDSGSGLFSTTNSLDAILLAELCLKDQRWPLYMRRSHRPFFEWQADPRAPLFTRAWAYQERLISTRVLYFTESELVFECFCSAACECGLTEYQLQAPRSPALDKFRKRWFFNVAVNRAKESPDQSLLGYDIPNQCQNHRGASDRAGGATGLCGTTNTYYPDFDPRVAWRYMVANYNALNLSNPQDRLPGIGAVAKQFQAVRPGERYLAGLWSGSFREDLLYFYDPFSSNSQSEPTTTPTWSWASMGSRPTFFLDCGKTFTVEIVDVNCCYFDDNPFGVLESSSLTLRGRLVSCWIDRCNSLRRRPLGKRIDCRFIYMDCDSYLSSAWRSSRKIHLLEVACVDRGRRSPSIILLILHREDRRRQVFSRVGVYHALLEDESEPLRVWLDEYGTTETLSLI